MTTVRQKKQAEQKSGINPVVAAVTGVVIGAAAAGIAGAAILANDNSRKKIEKAIDKTKDNVADIKINVEEKIAEGQEKVKKVLTNVKGRAVGYVDTLKTNTEVVKE